MTPPSTSEIARARERLQAWCDSQDVPLAYGEIGPSINYDDVRLLLGLYFAKPSEKRREAIARIIAPSMWASDDESALISLGKVESLRKADLIAALFVIPENQREVVARALCLSCGDDPDREGPWAEWWQQSGYAKDADAVLSVILKNPPKPSDDLQEAVAACVEAALERHGVPIGKVEGTLDDAETILSLIPTRGEVEREVSNRAITEAEMLLAELTAKRSSRKFHGIDEALRCKLATVRGTLARALTPEHPSGEAGHE